MFSVLVTDQGLFLVSHIWPMSRFAGGEREHSQTAS